ncbi:GNAT family protein [Pseudonocardia xishanensis]|uniref:N-acetyltransferase domain-containing protein n=1 Tax=Pseudonocardia xishanensis TaxID=630995 RepID=A0ABP8RW97_9PSEU
MSDHYRLTEVRPLTMEQVTTLIEDPDAFPARYGLRLAEGYLAFPEALAATREALAGGTPPEWFSHLIVDPEAGEVVGLGGYTGPPRDGAVEIGYSVAPGRRGRGHATAAAQTWVATAHARGVRRMRAHTLAEEGPSTVVLRRCGFTRVAELQDPEEGALWRWELTL